MCVYGGGVVPQGGVGDRHLVTIPQGVVGDCLPWGGERHRGVRVGLLCVLSLGPFTTRMYLVVQVPLVKESITCALLLSHVD